MIVFVLSIEIVFDAKLEISEAYSLLVSYSAVTVASPEAIPYSTLAVTDAPTDIAEEYNSETEVESSVVLEVEIFVSNYMSMSLPV